MESRLFLNKFVLENSNTFLYKLESLKEFVRIIIYAINNIKDDDTTIFEIIRNYWNYFTIGWRRKNPEISKNIIKSITNIYLFQYFFNFF
jgi:hypothetical protein